MNPRLVEQLERRIEEALSEIMDDTHARQLPLQPSPQILHLMAKAAVTVYEAAIETDRAPRH